MIWKRPCDDLLSFSFQLYDIDIFFNQFHLFISISIWQFNTIWHLLLSQFLNLIDINLILLRHCTNIVYIWEKNNLRLNQWQPISSWLIILIEGWYSMW
jgi:hypothetical protein